MSYIDLQTALINAGASLSAEIPLGEKTLVGVIIPAAWDAAGLTFQATPDDVTFSEMVDGAGNAISLTVAAGQFVLIDPAKWRGVTGIKVRSGTISVPVSQTANRSIILVTRTVY